MTYDISIDGVSLSACDGWYLIKSQYISFPFYYEEALNKTRTHYVSSPYVYKKTQGRTVNDFYVEVVYSGGACRTEVTSTMVDSSGNDGSDSDTHFFRALIKATVHEPDSYLWQGSAYSVRIYSRYPPGVSATYGFCVWDANGRPRFVFDKAAFGFAGKAVKVGFENNVVADKLMDDGAAHIVKYAVSNLTINLSSASSVISDDAIQIFNASAVPVGFVKGSATISDNGAINFKVTRSVASDINNMPELYVFLTYDWLSHDSVSSQTYGVVVGANVATGAGITFDSRFKPLSYKAVKDIGGVTPTTTTTVSHGATKPACSIKSSLRYSVFSRDSWGTPIITIPFDTYYSKYGDGELDEVRSYVSEIFSGTIRWQLVPYISGTAVGLNYAIEDADSASDPDNISSNIIDSIYTAATTSYGAVAHGGTIVQVIDAALYD